MADRVLFIGWGRPVRGREEKAVESFNDIVGLLGRMQQEGKMERFELVFLRPHGGDLGGCFICMGTAAQMDAIREDDDFRREMTRADLIVDGLGMIDGFTGEGIASQMELYNEAVSRVPQNA
jgi:hypothetical protein